MIEGQERDTITLRTSSSRKTGKQQTGVMDIAMSSGSDAKSDEEVEIKDI